MLRTYTATLNGHTPSVFVRVSRSVRKMYRQYTTTAAAVAAVVVPDVLEKPGVVRKNIVT